MGKVLKKIGTIVAFVGIAAAIIATGGLLAAGAPLLTSITTAFTATIGGIGLSASTILTAGIIASSVGAALVKGPRLEDFGADARGKPFVDQNALGAFVFGQTALPSVLIFEQNHGSEKEFVSDVFAHAWHKIDAYVSLKIEGEAVSFSGDNATGDYASILTWKRNVGTLAQSALALSGTVWASSANGAGMAHSAFIWNVKDQDQFQTIPQNFVIVARGALLYDPRLDTTAGGSGAQRYDDPATWTWNDGNAALVALRYLIGERSGDGDLIWGVGEAQGDVDIASFIAAANICDEVRDGVPRYRLGGFYPTSNDHAGFIQQWEASTGGKIARIGGKRYCWVPNDDLTPIDTITDNEIIAGAGVEMICAGDVRELYNTARGRYISAAEQYQGALYPDVVEAGPLADDGRARVLSVDFPWVQDVATAERLARYAIRRSRFSRVWSLAVGWRGLLYPPFSVLSLNVAETLGEGQLVRVVDCRTTLDGVCILTLQEEDAAIYDDTIELGEAPASDTIPDRLDRIGSLTARYLDGTPIDALVEDASNKRFAEGVTVSEGGSGRQIGIGQADGVAFDGDVITFAAPWASIPIIQFGAGGATFNSSIVGSQQQVFRALGVSTTGFTASLKLKSLSGSADFYEDGPGAFSADLDDPDWIIEKTEIAQDDNDEYRFYFTVSAEDLDVGGETIDGYVSIGLYTRSAIGGAWVQRATVFYDMSGAKSYAVTVDGLGADAAFGLDVLVKGHSGNNITAFTKVTYAEGTISEVTATPPGAPGVPYWIIGNKGAV